MTKHFLNVWDIYIYQLLYMLVIPLGFLIRVIYSKNLSIEDFGMFYALLSFFGFVSLFTNVGVSNSLRYYIPKYLVLKQYQKITNLFYYSLFIKITMIFIFSFFLYYFTNYLVFNYFHNTNIVLIFKLFIIYYIFSNLTDSLKDIFIGYKMNSVHQVISLIQFIFLIGFTVIILSFDTINLFNYIVFSWVLSMIFVFLIYLSILLYKFPYLLNFPKFEKKLFIDLCKHSRYLFLIALSFQIFTQVDIIIITFFLNTDSVAYYTNSFALVNTFISFFTALTIFFMPYITEFKVKKNFKLINIILDKLYHNIFYILLPFILILSLFSKQILIMIYGQKYILGFSVLILFSLFAIFKIIYSYNLSFIQSLGLGKKIWKIVLIIAIFNLIFDLILIKIFGIFGVGLITVFSWFLLSVFTYKLIFFETNFKINLLKLLKIIFCGFLFYLSVSLLKYFMIFNNIYIKIFLILFISFPLYFFLGYLINIYKFEDFYLFIPNNKIKKTIRNYHNKYFKFLK